MGPNVFDGLCDDVVTWDDIIAEIEEERWVVDLALGEEQLGRSLIYYTSANKERPHYTNGGDALFVFGPCNPFRVFCSELVHHPIFDAIVLILILGSSLTLALENPREDQDSQKYEILFGFNVFFTVVFVLEMVLKNFAMGFVFIEGAYLRDPWNWLDFLVVIVSVLSLALQTSEVSALKVFRTFRALRPLRMIHQNRGLKMVVMTLLLSIKGIANVALLSLLNYLIFGILAVQFFNGKLHRCNDDSIQLKVNCTGNFTFRPSPYTNPRVVERVWRSQQANFDNIGNSMLTLFQISTGDNWSIIMYDAIDAISDDVAPQPNTNPAVGLFFIAFFVISNFFMLNLFVGVIIYNFNGVKSKLDGLALLSEEQRQWVETQRLMLKFRPEVLLTPGDLMLSKLCFRVVSHYLFEVAVAVAVLLNIVIIAMDYYNQPEEYAFVLSVLNNVFVLLFLLEATVKILAYRLNYFASWWNRFDFLLALLGLVGFILSLTGNDQLEKSFGLLRVIRIFRRILRILRLFKQLRKVRVLIETLWYSLPSLVNISIFMLLIYFVYSVLGVQLFALVEPGEFLDDKFINFYSFLSSMQLMFIFTTNEDWSRAMADTMRRPPYCLNDDSCGTPFAPLFFVSFSVISAMVVMNLFIAIILDNFSTTMRMDQSQLTMADLHRYTEIWSQFDEEATMVVATRELPKLLAAIQPPLGLSRACGRLEILRVLDKYDIPEHAGYVHFVEVLIPLAKVASGVEISDRNMREQRLSIEKEYPELSDMPFIRFQERVSTVAQYFAATYIASAERRRTARKRVQRMLWTKREERSRPDPLPEWDAMAWSSNRKCHEDEKSEELRAETDLQLESIGDKSSVSSHTKCEDM